MIIIYKVLYTTISILIFTVILNGCGKFTESRKEKKYEQQQKQEQINKKSQNKMNELFYREKSVLLAIKYKLEESKVFNLLVETQSLDIEKIESSIEEIFITKSRLNLLSEKYGLPVETIASLLIDYYSMQTSDN